MSTRAPAAGGTPAPTLAERLDALAARLQPAPCDCTLTVVVRYVDGTGLPPRSDQAHLADLCPHGRQWRVVVRYAEDLDALTAPPVHWPGD